MKKRTSLLKVKIARKAKQNFTITGSNLQVPMFAHAGDSDDEDEDRENLVRK